MTARMERGCWAGGGECGFSAWEESGIIGLGCIAIFFLFLDCVTIQQGAVKQTHGRCSSDG